MVYLNNTKYINNTGIQVKIKPTDQIGLTVWNLVEKVLMFILVSLVVVVVVKIRLKFLFKILNLLDLYMQLFLIHIFFTIVNEIHRIFL